jgi:hypothetical protein
LFLYHFKVITGAPLFQARPEEGTSGVVGLFLTAARIAPYTHSRMKANRDLTSSPKTDSGSDDTSRWFRRTGRPGRLMAGLLYGGAVWQIARFMVTVLLVSLAVYPRLDPRYVLLFVWPSTIQLAAAAGFYFLARRTDLYSAYRRLLVLAKLLDVVPGLMLLSYQVTAVFFGIGRALHVVVPALDSVTGSESASALIFHYSLFALVFLDLIFLLVLLSFRLPQETAGAASNADLPELTETTLEDEPW